MSHLRSTVVVVGASLLGMGFVNMAAEAVTGKPIFSSRKEEATQTETSTEWVLPVEADISTKYNVKGESWASGRHTGIDFPVSSGADVKASGPGEVVKSGNAGSYGLQVVIKHESDVYTQYAHLSRLDVKEGEEVGSGQVIGSAGSTGNSSGPHLHFEARKGPSYGDDIDPIAFLEDRGALK